MKGSHPQNPYTNVQKSCTSALLNSAPGSRQTNAAVRPFQNSIKPVHWHGWLGWLANLGFTPIWDALAIWILAQSGEGYLTNCLAIWNLAQSG